MPKRRENMLEAFKASVDRESAQERKLLRAGLPPGAGSPRGGPGADPQAPPRDGAPPPAAPSARPVQPVAQPSLADLGGRPEPESEGLVLPFGIWAFLGLQAVALALAYFLGTLAGAGGGAEQALAGGPDGSTARPFELESPRATRSGSETPTGSGAAPVAAGVGAARPDPARAEDAPPGAAGAEPSAADRAFADPANRYTVVVFSADDYVVGRERTWAMFEHLAAQGFEPVTPRAVRGRLALFVGAAPKMGDLEDLKDEVRGLLGPDGRTRPFRDAWINNIDHYQ